MRGSAASAHFEDDAKPRLAAHHPIVGGLGVLEGENLVHRTHVVNSTEGERIFGIGGPPPRISALHGRALAEQANRESAIPGQAHP